MFTYVKNGKDPTIQCKMENDFTETLEIELMKKLDFQ